MIVVSSANCAILKEYLPISTPLMSLLFTISRVKILLQSETGMEIWDHLPSLQPLPMVIASDKNPHCRMFAFISVLKI